MMFEPKIVNCNNCGWVGEREEPDLYIPCPICGSEKDIIALEGKANLGEETIFPEFKPSIEHNPPKTISLEEIYYRDLVDNMKETIGMEGETETWEWIEKLTGDIKFEEIEIYLEAIRQLKNEQGGR